MISSRFLPPVALLVLGLASCTPRPSREMGPAPGFIDNLEEKRFVTAPGVAALDGFSQAIKIGKRVYLSGQLPVDSTGRLVGSDLASQSAQVFSNLRTLLLAAGSTPEDVFRLDIQVVGLKGGELGLLSHTDTTFFPRGRWPVGSIVGVEALPVEGALLAITAQAETRGLFPDRMQLQRYRQP